MPAGKPAGVPCAQMTPDNRCRIYGRPARPRVCDSYQASEEYCGTSREEALRLLNDLELRTSGKTKLKTGGRGDTESG